MVDVVEVPTRRLIILNRIKQWLLAMDGPQFQVPSVVELGPLSAADNRKLFSIGIVPGRETKRTFSEVDQATLPIAVEFRMTANKGDNVPEQAEYRLGELQLRLANLAPILRAEELAADFGETGNEIDIDGYLDRTIAGVIFMQVLYRHSTSDPHVAV